jgi:hypothetical protein
MSELKLKYKFNTQDEADMYEYGNLVRAQVYRALLSEMFRTFRAKSDHGDSGDEWAVAYKTMWDMAVDEGLNPWEEIF